MRQYQKNIIDIFVIVIGGFILFNLAFLLAALVVKTTIIIFGEPQNGQTAMVGRMVSLILVFLMSWFVLRSRWNTLTKATYLTMPLMVILMMTGISLYKQPIGLTIGVGAAVIFAVLSYLYKKRLSWLYLFAVLYVSVLAFCILIFHVQI